MWRDEYIVTSKYVYIWILKIIVNKKLFTKPLLQIVMSKISRIARNA